MGRLTQRAYARRIIDHDRLLDDSTSDGPSFEDCYADPAGSEIVGDGDGRSDAPECVVTFSGGRCPVAGTSR